MNIVLGFGSSEKEFEKQEFKFVEDFILDKSKEFSGDKYDFGFSNELVAELKDKLQERKDEYDRLAAQYKEATDFPDRYSTYHFNILTDRFANLCVIFKFTHINRKHPLSSDGWAGMYTKEVCYIDAWDYR